MIHLYSILALAGIAYCFASADAAPDDPSAVDGTEATLHEMTLVFALMASYWWALCRLAPLPFAGPGGGEAGSARGPS